MSVLVDTSVWTDHLHKGNARLAQLLNDGEVLVHPFVIGELACGRLKNRGEILSLLQALPVVPKASDDELLQFIERNQLEGKGLALVDVHLLASSCLIGTCLWTRDKAIERVAESLKLAY
jgi:predicted nucleic acid-binding protein